MRKNRPFTDGIRKWSSGELTLLGGRGTLEKQIPEASSRMRRNKD
jgi:hypothetical protein